MHFKKRHVYVGVDLHKETHTAVVIDCWSEILAEIKIENKPSAFQGLLDEVKKSANGLTPIFGLEDVGGYGRSLAVFLVEKGEIVKEVNSALSHAQRMSHAMTAKNDAWDAYCVACVLLLKLKSLPDANPQDVYWTIAQLVNRRNSLVRSLATLTNQLHSQLTCHYPSYKKFFADVAGKTALAFWEAYPSPQTLQGVQAEDLAALLRQNSHNSCSTKKAEAILDLVGKDGDTTRAYQETRDFIVKSIAANIRTRQRDIAETEKALRQMLDVVDCRLETMPGVDTVTAAALIANIGDVRRFGSADKLARFAGVAPVRFSSAGKGKDQKSKQGNRELHSILYFLAIQQVQVAKVSGKPRNPVFHDYYQRKITEGKTKKQALVCVMRRLVNIVYGMMKHRTAYIMPDFPEKEAV